MSPGIPTFIVLASVLTIVPGPDTLLVLRNTMQGGLRAGTGTTLGICSGLFVHATLSAVGVSALLATSASLFTALKFLGAAYLIWLRVSRSYMKPRVSRALDYVAGGALLVFGARHAIAQR